jgi:pyruvate formate lyase activating enzyme
MGSSTWCHECGELLIERDWYQLGRWNLLENAGCTSCGAKLPGHFEARPGNFGAHRIPVQINR